MSWLDSAMEAYMDFIKSRTKTYAVDNGWHAITTPFLNMFNDCIEIYCKNDGDKIILSDDGLTLQNLEMLGVSFTRSKKNQSAMERILLNYGVSVEGDELMLAANIDKFPQAKHNLLSAIMEISDMYMIAKQQSSFSLFKEDVSSYLDEQEIIYTPSFISKGNNLEFHFDFQIAGRKTEILINTFSTINKTNLTLFLYGWSDIKAVREQVAQKEIKGLAIINNTDKEINAEYLDEIIGKGSGFMLWGNRHNPDSIEKLKAA